MTKIRPALIALVCLLCPGPVLAETVKLGHAVKPAGTSCDEAKTVEIKVTANGRTMEVATRVRKTIVILASARDTVTRAKITYSEFVNPEGPATDAVGPTYVLASDGKTFSITRADGKPLGANERRLVEKDNNEFGKPDVFARALLGIAFERGKRTVVPASRLVGWESFPQPVNVAMTLTETRGPNAQFKLELDAGDPQGEKISLTGTAVVERAGGELLSLVGDGTFAMKGVPGAMHMVASLTCKR